VLNNLGLALHARGDLREALGYYEQALDAFHRAGEKGAWEAAVLQNLALVNTGLGEPEAALRSHQEVLALQRGLGDKKGEAQTLNNLGVLYNNLGRPGEALEVYAPALAIFRQTGDRSWEATLLHNVGAAYYGLGDDPRAVANLEAALAIRREAGDRRGEAMTEVSLGHARLRSGEPARAREAGRRAAELAAVLPDRRVEMLARLLLGEAGVAAGEPEAALSELARARELAHTLEDRLGEARGLQIAGQAYLARKQPEEALRVLTEAVALSRAIQRPGRIVASLTDLARAERMANRPADAQAHLDEALRLIETLRAAESDPDLRASYLASTHAAFELAVDLRMELDRREPGKGHAREALEVSERARARSLLDLLQEAEADVREGIDPSLRGRERALLLRLNAKAGRQADLLKRPASEERRRAADGEVRAVLEELDQVDAEIRRDSPRYAALTRPSPATVPEIQGLLDGGTVLLEYALGEERSFLWAVDRGSVTAFELPPRARIEAVARELYSRLSVLSPGDARLDAAARELSRMLLGPVAKKLGERRLVVVADGELHTLPFGLLPDPGAPGSPLLVRHEVVNAPSASAVALQRRLARRPAAPGSVAVLADPVFDPGDPRVPARKPATRSAAPESGPLLRLPWTRREAQAIAAVAPPGRSLLALDFRASRATALSPELARYRIVHFATHGLIDPRTPALSGLMLSRVDERGAPREGFLGLRDVYNLRLGADLVVLSGCETALGRKLRGEGLVGLTRGFLYAGARQVAASLWRVEDQATAELMSRFYRHLLVEHRPPAAALRLAQLAVRNDKRWRSPYYWSGFVLQGDWRSESPR
jgi:CHAT domain-containing protein/Tfp pilus assembly protein PilF